MDAASRDFCFLGLVGISLGCSHLTIASQNEIKIQRYCVIIARLLINL